MSFVISSVTDVTNYLYETTTSVLSTSYNLGVSILSQASFYPTYVTTQWLQERIQAVENLESPLPFFANPDESKPHDLLAFYDEERLKKELYDEVKLLLDYDEDVSLLYQHLKKACEQKELLPQTTPTLSAEPLDYLIPTSLPPCNKSRQVTFQIPVDVENSFDRFSYSLDSKLAKPTQADDRQNRKHIAAFCAKFHAFLNLKTENIPALNRAVHNNIGQILEKVFLYACLDGLGIEIHQEDVSTIQLPADSVLSEVIQLLILPDSGAFINFEVDGAGFLVLTFTIVNMIIILSDEGETHESTLRSLSSAKVKFNLYDLDDKQKVEFFRLPFVPTPKPNDS